MSDYNEHSSLYENSDYPSRRQAPGRSSQSSGGGGGKKRKRRKKRSPILRSLGILFKVLGTLLLIGLCTGAIMACFAAVYINEVIVPIADLSIDDFPLGENSIMYYQDKETGQWVEMATLLNVTSQIWVDYDEMPEYLKQAAVAIEDKRFWTHPGVDWKGTAKAVLSMFTGGEVSGGSTITQQLIKNMTDYNETTVKRKITEIVRALRFTQNNTKQDTLERYLNIIPLGNKYGGGGSYEGVGSAALGYFGKPVSELTLAECASLIAITNNPSKYGPYSFAKSQGKDTDELWDARRWNKYRQGVILWEMLDQGMISQAEYDEAVAQELVFVKDQSADNDEIYTWYEETVISDVREALAREYNWSAKQANQALARGGLRIYTCFDPDIQAIVDEIYTDRSNLDYTSKDGQLMQSSIAVIDNESHDLVAIAGQFGEKTLNYGSNYASDGHRPSGSSIKPLSVYSPAIEMGKINPYSVIDDYPYQELGGTAWPKNSGTNHYRGHIPIYDALRKSLNTVAVRLTGDYVTPEESFKFVQDRYHIELEPGRMVYGEWKSDLSIAPLALGGLTNGTNVRDMAEAYSVFPNGGYYNSSHTFTRVTQLVDGGEVPLLETVSEEEQVIKETTAWYMNNMLQGVLTGGTGGGYGIRGQHAAGKTGTTSDDFDRWFAGYTPYYTTVVWTGYEQNRKMVTKNGVNPALVLWNKVMTQLHEGLPDKDYSDPGGRRSLTYCLDSGLLATEYCAMDPRGSRVASGSVFPEDYPTDKPCPYHTAESVVTVCLDSPVLNPDGKPTGMYHQAGEFCPEESRKEICYPNYAREQVGTATADDEIWRYESASAHGPCTLHTEAPVTEPDPNDPFTDPTDPNGPTQEPDPNEPDQGGVFPNVPVPPPDPLVPPDDMAG